MTLFWWSLGLLLAAIWVHRAVDAITGIRTVPDIARPQWDRVPAPAPRVTIIVPARNEQERVEATLRSLLALDYPDYEIIAINDRSTDGTSQIMERISAKAGNTRLRLLHVRELPPGWLGKTHAMWLAAQQATGEWLLFTDADVVFRRDALRRAIAYAQHSRPDHLVVFPSYVLETVGERMTMAAFQLLFIFGHRPWKVADAKADDFMGLGPFNLIRRSAYEGVGTFQALRMEVIEDMKLGKLVKKCGYAQRNVFGEGLLSWRWGRGGFGIVRNLTKNFFALMQFRWGRALGASLLYAVLNLAPFLGIWLAPGWARLPFALALVSLATLYMGLWRGSGIAPLYFFLHPLGALMLLYTMLRSGLHALRHGGVVWRGTLYSLEELRRGLV